VTALAFDGKDTFAVAMWDFSRSPARLHDVGYVVAHDMGAS
jgi:hypothetical protein